MRMSPDFEGPCFPGFKTGLTRGRLFSIIILSIYSIDALGAGQARVCPVCSVLTTGNGAAPGRRQDAVAV